ncbi:MAG: 5'-nucleotidase C-terminal domain-containing protein [Armatimonadota bacterium]
MKRINSKIVIVSLLALALGVAVFAAQAQAPISSEDSGKEETSFGDLLADAIRSAAEADAAMVAAVSCKPGTIPAGAVSQQDLQSLLQNPSEVWAVSKLTGQQILDAMEKSLSRLPGTNSGFLQISGMQVTYDADGERNSRVQSVTINGSPLDPSAEYSVAMPLSLAKGGSGYFTVFDATDISGAPSRQSLLGALVEYVNEVGTLNYSGQERLIAQ